VLNRQFQLAEHSKVGEDSVEDDSLSDDESTHIIDLSFPAGLVGRLHLPFLCFPFRQMESTTGPGSEGEEGEERFMSCDVLLVFSGDGGNRACVYLVVPLSLSMVDTSGLVPK
jgi:hypothetical protein